MKFHEIPPNVRGADACR